MSGLRWTRLGMLMEPEADYERRPDGSGGCEDPRITFVESLQRYLMAYTAFSSDGPRIPFAVSRDLFHWTRLGLATFAPYQGIDFVHVDDKDASLFPIAIPNHAGKMQIGILHRPLFRGTRPEETACKAEPRAVDNVVFPTGIDRRDDIGSPDRFDVYFGMADDRIGVARLDLPEHLPQGAPADGRDDASEFPHEEDLKIGDPAQCGWGT